MSQRRQPLENSGMPPRTVSAATNEDPASLDQVPAQNSASPFSLSAGSDSSVLAGSVEYDAPAAYRNLDEVSAPPPVQNPDEAPLARSESLEQRRSHGRSVDEAVSVDRQSSAAPTVREVRNRRRSAGMRVDYDIPDVFANLDELAASRPIENPNEDVVYRHRSLEDARSAEQEYERRESLSDAKKPRRGILGRIGAALARREPVPTAAAAAAAGQGSSSSEEDPGFVKVSRLATEIYTLSYLVLFSILGTLARLGLQALTVYPGAPVSTGVLWANFAGSLVMGFLAEDRMLFRYEWGTPTYDAEIGRAAAAAQSGSADGVPTVNLAAAKKAHLAAKKTIPLYIGLATGFCGSFTSFSSFIRDVFLAVSNDLPGLGTTAADLAPRNGGYSFMAALAVVLLTLCLSLGGLFAGAHLAIALEPLTPSLPFQAMRRGIDRAAVILGWGSWLGAVLMAAMPPDGREVWRGQVLFALVFAPLGCLVRFYASLRLNGRIVSFPLGTFTVNVAGTAVLAMAWDLAHVGKGGLIGCQVLQGIEDGFCGCLTTVSTWVAELAALRRRHAYVYGGTSVLVALALIVAIMGGLRWSIGFDGLLCTH